MSFRPLKSRQLVLLGMTAPAILLGLVGWLQWSSVQDYQSAREIVTHGRIILFDEEALVAELNAAETGQRGYLLTHRDNYLAPYLTAPARAREFFRELQDVVRLPEQKARLDRLKPLMDSKLAELAQTVALEQSNQHAAAMKIVLSDAGQSDMDRIRQTLADMHNVTRERLAEREEAYQKSSRLNAELSDLLIGAGVLVMVGIFCLLRRVERMHQMIKICAWSKLIEHDGQWLSIEEYLTKRYQAQITHGMSDVEAKKMLELLQAELPEVDGRKSPDAKLVPASA